MKVLIIEDTRTHALVSQVTLEANGVSDITLVSDAESALKCLDRETYDVLLVDHYLPGMSGLDLVKAVRSCGNDVGIVMLTGQSHAEVAADCMKSGANDYLCKDEAYPQLLPDVVRKAHRHVQAERHARELERQLKRKCDELESTTRRLVDYQRQMVQSQKMMAIITLVRGICHELNNPLTGILGYAQLLQEIWTGDGVDDLKEIEQCAQRCRDIIGKLSKFCRNERPSIGTVNVNDAIEESLQFVEYYANRHRVKLVADLQRDLPPTQGNRLDLRQAFLAVFLNGVQAMIPTKGGVLTVKSYAFEQFIYVVVSDTGEGIPAENIERIFLPFFTTREVGEGSGMGLAIAYGIMQDHEGTILVDSSVGAGSTISFVMPVRVSVPVANPAQTPTAATA